MPQECLSTEPIQLRCERTGGVLEAHVDALSEMYLLEWLGQRKFNLEDFLKCRYASFIERVDQYLAAPFGTECFIG